MLRRVLPLAAVFSVAFSAFSASVVIDGRRFSVAEGFTVERVATTNQVLRPVNACLDDRGRLYVTDASGSSQPPAEQAKDPRWRVLRLEDRDGDGQFEHSEIFADKLPMLQGILWHDGVVYVGGTPAIWKLLDKDGDGRADERIEWWNVGRPSTHCGNEVHGPYAGPDGFIYWTKGAFEPIQWTNGVSGKAHLDRGAHIFRARPDGSEMDSIMTGGMDNPVEVAFTADGECIFTSTFIDFSQPGFRDGLAHAIYGGVYGKENSNVEDRAVKRTGPDLLHPFVQYGAGAPSGLCRATSPVWGDPSQNHFFATLFNLHKITRHQLRASGATFAADSTDFLTTEDTDFHPTDVLEDIDGSILVVDTGGWYKLCCPTSQLWKPDVLGNLYRVRPLSKSGKLVRAPASTPSRRVTATVRKSNTSGWQARVSEAKGEPFATHAAIEALIRTGAVGELRSALDAPSPAVQRAALIALAELDGTDLKPQEVTPFLTSSDAELRRAADWIIRRRSDWGETLIEWAKLQLSTWAQDAKVAQVKTLIPVLLRNADGQKLLAQAAGNLGYSLPLRNVILDGLANAGIKEPPPSWNKLVAAILSDRSAVQSLGSQAAQRDLFSSALRLLRQLKPLGAEDSAQRAAQDLAATLTAPIDIRLQSLASRSARSPLGAPEFDLVLKHLSPDVNPTLRSLSVKALTRSQIARDQRAALLEALREVGPLEINALLPCFEEGAGDEMGQRLLASLRAAKARNSLRPEQLKPVLAKYSPTIQSEGAELLAQLLPDLKQQSARIDALLKELKSIPSDSSRGQAVFNSTKTACVQCHRIGYAGGEVGPNLTRIGEARTERDLLEAVVYPSASFVRSYEPVTVITKSGDAFSGMIKDESDTTVTLVLGPGAEQRIPREDVVEQRPSPVSMMPSGLDEQLSRQELADLVTFLKNTHWGAK